MFCLERRETDSLPQQDRRGDIWETARNSDELGVSPDLSSHSPSNASTSLGIPETSELRALTAQINRMWTKAENSCPGVSHTLFSPEVPFLVFLPWNLKFSGRNSRWLYEKKHFPIAPPSGWASAHENLYETGRRTLIHFRASQDTKYLMTRTEEKKKKKTLAKMKVEWRNSGAIQEAWMSSGTGEGRQSKLFIKKQFEGLPLWSNG